MTSSTPITFKFGPSKRPQLNLTNKATSSNFETVTNNNDDQPQLITELNNGEIKTNAPVEVKKQLIIPCPVDDIRRLLKSKSAKAAEKTELEKSVDSLDSAAKQALLLDADQANRAWNDRNENGSRVIQAIESQTTNTFASRLDNQRENEDENQDEEKQPVENPNYDQVPIEDFGMAVLLGMGYKEGGGIGTSNKKAVDVFVAQTRPRGLGLGADRNVLEKLNSLKRKARETGIDEKDDLCMEKGAFVQVQKGRHTDLYGVVESIDEDVSRLTLALAIGGTNKKKEVISISQFSVRLVTEKEYLKYSKYVNKSKAEEVEKETSEELMKNYHKPSKNNDDRNGDDNRDRNRDRDRTRDRSKSRSRSRDRSRDRDRNRDRDYDRHRDHHRHKDRHEDSKKSRRH